MAAKKGHRDWGYIVQLPNKSKRFEASYIGPDKKRHYAPTTFTFKRNAEGWLANERAFIERTAMTGEVWTSPKQRAAVVRAESVTLGGLCENLDRTPQRETTNPNWVRIAGRIGDRP